MTTQIDPVFLLKAIKSRKFLDLHIKKRSNVLIFGSRFLKLLDDQRSIVVQCPTIRGVTYQILKKNDPIAVTFQTGGFRFHFRSKVLESFEYAQSDHEAIPALKISWPVCINESNRRLFYRIGVRLDESIEIKYSGCTDQENNDGRQLKSKGSQGVAAIMTDISEKGMAIEIKSNENVEIGWTLHFSFRFKEDNTWMKIKGIVRSIRKSKDLKIQYLGIQFLEPENSNCRVLMERIVKHAVSGGAKKIDFQSHNMIVSNNIMIQKIADGDVVPETIDLILSRYFPLSYTEYLEVMVFVLKSPAFQHRARQFLHTIPPGIKQSYVKERFANDRVVEYLLQEALKDTRTETVHGIIENPFLPIRFYLKIAREASPAMLHLLIKNKNKLIAYPEIMSVMEKNPGITASIRSQISMIRECYEERVQSENISGDDIISEFTESELSEISTSSKQHAGKSAEINSRILDLLNKINAMSPSERIRLALVGNRAERFILSKDPDRTVASALLENPDLDSSELREMVEAHKRPITLLKLIAERDHILRDDDIVSFVLSHPDFQQKNVSPVLNKLKMTQLETLIHNPSINSNIRLSASGLFQKKREEHLKKKV